MMRDKKRIKKILSEIERIWMTYPDMRFGQLLENIMSSFGNDRMFSWHYEDDKLLDDLKKHKGW